MTAPVSPRDIAALERLAARLRGEATPKRAPCAGRVRALAMDGLDNQAIAALTGASIGAVSVAVSRMRRRLGAKARRGRPNGACGELLVMLPDAARGALILAAKDRGIGPSELAAEMIAGALAQRGLVDGAGVADAGHSDARHSDGGGR